jgi:hypothetical protein
MQRPTSIPFANPVTGIVDLGISLIPLTHADRPREVERRELPPWVCCAFDLCCYS